VNDGGKTRTEAEVHHMTFRMTTSLMKAMRERAKADGVSMQALLTSAICEKLGWVPNRIVTITDWEPPEG